MSFIVGTYRIFYLKVGNDWIPIGCLTDTSFTESSEMLGTTTRDNTDGWESSIPTNQNYSISFNGMLTDEFTSDTKVTYYDLKALKRERTPIEWKIDDLLGHFETGGGYISDLGDANTVDEFVSFSGTIIGSGIIVNPRSGVNVKLSAKILIE